MVVIIGLGAIPRSQLPKIEGSAQQKKEVTRAYPPLTILKIKNR